VHTEGRTKGVQLERENEGLGGQVQAIVEEGLERYGN